MLTRIKDLSKSPAELADLLDRATQLSQLYDDYVESDPGDGHLRAPGVHASELAGCERKVLYSVLDTPKEGGLTKNWRQRFALGKAVHKMIQDDFHVMASKSKGLIRFEDEVPISPKHQEIAKELSIYSSADGVFSLLDDPLGPVVLRIGLEIKTEAPDGYSKLTAPYEKHLDQAHVYMRCLDLPLFYFMYINKGNQNNTPSIAPYLVTFDQARWDRLETKARRVLRMVGTDQMPDREEGIECSFCPYKTTCGPSIGKKGSGSASWKQPRK